ncbi:MAG: hypothetical protein A2V52_05040 [Actinobacteria bacterium RBG_19FT_COMBO_54_7]|uniref:Glutaredoxin domain-containing protein n=1 Tax=Candidatus Solincola sediminis TaxID=1797199 RepID=A0A1F2WHR2_9ACTN|nr:MAG: hypothetical protein A2Y75_03550 [Candidatus Solincola sediminis]OFW58839.1 MAG: hypothetical protein A2W01_01475 [Candidatus Solincola sediminis]OFW70302.1 MAG: hypothetical protein A2V52_05040 [Actinobacteria bacterium RBG_19FT_COMBO_54_7]
MAKDFLDKEGVDVEVIDVAKDQQAATDLVNKSGQMGVPVMEVKNVLMVGFDRDAYKKALEDAGVSSQKN